MAALGIGDSLGNQPEKSEISSQQATQETYSVEGIFADEKNQELIDVDPGIFLEMDHELRTNQAGLLKNERALNEGNLDLGKYEKIMADYEKMLQEGTEPVPIAPRDREVGQIRSVYDLCINVRRIAELTKEGAIKINNNKIGLDRIYRNPDQIDGDLNRSLLWLDSSLSFLDKNKKLDDLSREEKEQIEMALIRTRQAFVH